MIMPMSCGIARVVYAVPPLVYMGAGIGVVSIQVWALMLDVGPWQGSEQGEKKQQNKRTGGETGDSGRNRGKSSRMVTGMEGQGGLKTRVNLMFT